MFNPANTAHFTLSIDGAEQHRLQVLAFHSTEAISTPYAIEIDCISDRPDLDLESRIGVSRHWFLQAETSMALQALSRVAG